MEYHETTHDREASNDAFREKVQDAIVVIKEEREWVLKHLNSGRTRRQQIVNSAYFQRVNQLDGVCYLLQSLLEQH